MAKKRPDESSEEEEAAPVPTLSGRHRGTLEAIFERPTRADIRWKAIEALLLALGGEITEGRGSRVRVALLGQRATFHEPHPKPSAAKGAVEDVRDFLVRAGVEP